MSLCVLKGHEPMEPMRGAGQFSNRYYVLCRACGLTLWEGAETALPRDQPFTFTTKQDRKIEVH